jgi:BirA family transcriptional regulator, biotin operon repressor / biotin---[acetyl-CoA-carboxylase] ligase
MIGSTIVHLDTVDSTNNYAARELLTKSLKEGTIFAAACQDSGRGQGQSAWESATGMNLTFSIVLYPKTIEIRNQFMISKSISLAVLDFLSDYTNGLSVKWPNDIYAGDKKIAGILIETAISAGKFSRAIVGIGLNINQETFFSGAPNPVSLKKLTGQSYELPVMLDLLCRKLDNRYNQLLKGYIGIINRDYESVLYRIGQWAWYMCDGVRFEAMIAGVDPEGQLVLETRQGEIKSFQFKEVQFL